MSHKVTNYFIKQPHKYRMYMNFLQRLEHNIKNNFPGITDSELKERVRIAKHIIALNHENKLQQSPITSKKMINDQSITTTTKEV